MSYKFKMGDRVKGLGMTGTIAQVNYGSDSFIINWDKKYNYANTFVHSDGRLSPYGEPCVELIQKATTTIGMEFLGTPKPVVKETKRYYKAYYHTNGVINETAWFASKEQLIIYTQNLNVIKIVYKDFTINKKR